MFLLDSSGKKTIGLPVSASRGNSISGLLAHPPIKAYQFMTLGPASHLLTLTLPVSYKDLSNDIEST